MSLFRETDPRFRGLGLKVFLFAVLGVIAAVALLVTLAIQQGFFTSHTELRIEAPTGTDLRPGMAVKLSGFKIGDVKSVRLNDRARVDLVLRIEDQYMWWIKADSVVSNAREGVIGDPFLSVTAGDPGLDPVKPGEILIYRPAPALADIAQDLRTRILPVIDGTTKTLEYFNDPKSDFRGAIAEMKMLASELRETRRQVDRLVVDLDEVARKDLRETLDKADQTLDTVSTEITALSDRTDVSLAKLDAATTEAQATAAEATKAIDSAAPRVDSLLDEARKAVKDSRKLMNGIGKRWPFKGGEVPKDEVPAATGGEGATPREHPGDTPEAAAGNTRPLTGKSPLPLRQQFLPQQVDVREPKQHLQARCILG